LGNVWINVKTVFAKGAVWINVYGCGHKNTGNLRAVASSISNKAARGVFCRNRLSKVIVD
jgi:hypothetical protein